jgi:hypothetical protein
MATDISDPSTEEISFLRKLYDAGGDLSLQGNVGQKLERLFPDYVTQQSAGMDTVHFTLTEKGREFINR